MSGMSRRRYRRRPDLDSGWWWAGQLFIAALWLVLAAFWVLWAIIALTVAGIASLGHRPDRAQAMIRSLNWSRKRQQRPRLNRGYPVANSGAAAMTGEVAGLSDRDQIRARLGWSLLDSVPG